MTSSICGSFCGSIGRFFADPDKVNLSTPSYYFKKTVAVIGKFTDWPVPWASVMRKVNECTLPYLGYIASNPEAVAAFGAPIANAIAIIDVGECWNDFNYFLNGGALNDIRHGQIGSLGAHILLVPANAIGVAQFLRAADLANVIGECRVFSFAASASPWLGEVQVFSWVPKLATYGAIGTGTLCGAYALFGADATYRIWKYDDLFGFFGNFGHKGKAEEYKEALHKWENNEKMDARSRELVDKCKLALEKKHGHKRDAVTDDKVTAMLKVKVLNNENKGFQAKLDLIASVAELVLKAAVIVFAITSLPILFVIGTATALAVGTSLYYRATSSKPDLAYVMQ